VTAVESAALTRFSRAERLVHRGTAVLMTSCLLTGFVLYYGPVTLAVGHRRIVELVHVWSGFALPLPMLLGAASAAYRADLGRLNRFSAADWRWLRSRSRRDGSIRVGKFNAGQKLNACLTAGSILVLLGSGTLLFLPGLVRLSWREGATFVHDWFALALGLLVIGHIWFAITEPEAREGMRTGTVPRYWARHQHADWVAEVDAGQDPQP
jgi:formate dehydrogenase subunit gamma